MTRGRIPYICNTQHAQYNLSVLAPSIRLGAAILDFCGIAGLSFLRLNLQPVAGVSSLSKMETRECHGATIQNIMAPVMHAYLICGHVGEVHLILSAILAADFLAVDPCCVPPSWAEMCGTAVEAERKKRSGRHRRGRHQKAQHPYSTPLNNHIHVCGLIWNTMNALCCSVAALPQLPRWPPLASHCL